MKNRFCGDKKGFTIIETSLVLAIAGLILVMAFIALPALQRQQRDTKRKDDTMLFVQALKKYQQNNRGTLPKYEDPSDAISIGWHDKNSVADWSDSDRVAGSAWAAFYNDYLGDDFTNPNGEKYTLLLFDCHASGSSASCDPAGHSYEQISSRKFEERDADWFVYIGATCENSEPVKSSNNRNAAVVTKLEVGDGVYCTNT